MTSSTQDVEQVLSLSGFVDRTSDREPAGEPLAAVSARTVRIDVDGGVWLKPGAAIAYRGTIAFDRRATIDAASVPDAMIRETAPLVRAHGRGRLYCGAHGAHAQLVRLGDESLVVAWNDLLAFEDRLVFEPGLVGHGVGLAAGGLVAVRLSGRGIFALSTHGRPLTLGVSPEDPVSTDPHATLAWSASLEPKLKTDLSWRSTIGHGGQEPVQMHFTGSGFVVVQPYEDPGRFDYRPHPFKRLASLIPI